MPVATPDKTKLRRISFASSLINGFGNHVANKNSHPIINIGFIFLLFTLLKYNILILGGQTNPTNNQNTFPLTYKITSSPFVLIDLISSNLYLLVLYSTNNQYNNYFFYAQVFEYIVLML